MLPKRQYYTNQALDIPIKRARIGWLLLAEGLRAVNGWRAAVVGIGQGRERASSRDRERRAGRAARVRRRAVSGTGRPAPAAALRSRSCFAVIAVADVLYKALAIFLPDVHGQGFNSDEAIVGLMARHILRGERPRFFYGQAYMGSLDPFLVAGGFRLFGPEIWVIRLVQILLYCGFIYTGWLLGRRLLKDPQAADFAALIMAVPPLVVLTYTSASLGGYGESLLFGNLILLLGMMSSIDAVMTLPGIAGFILTIGMGVDSNVLIFERIKEELATSRGVRAAVNAGFDRVWWTIVDTHVASLIAAAFLFQFGTGPIRGFATTLAIGLLSNVFTAVFVSRTLFEIVLTRRHAATLSI